MQDVEYHASPLLQNNDQIGEYDYDDQKDEWLKNERVPRFSTAAGAPRRSLPEHCSGLKKLFWVNILDMLILRVYV